VDEITTKLRQAERLMAGGQSQAQACKGLGVSVMTYHRWRKQHPASERRELGAPAAGGHSHAEDQEEKLRLENDRLRRIVTDLLLEKAKIDEQIALNSGSKSVRRNWV
jgi:putative transposase